MKNKVLMLLALMAGLIAFNVYAEDSQPTEDSIRAECKEESTGAENPQVFYDECVADRMQALKDDQGGGSGDVPPDRG